MLGFRRRLRSTTMLFGAVGAAFLSVSAYAGDPVLFAAKPITDYAPGVDGFNGKVEPLGGSLANRSLAGNQGALSFPLGGPLGVQIDAAFGSFDNRGFGNIAGHLFWRNPGQGLIGIYTSHTLWDQFGGAYVGQVAGEGEFYSGRWTLQGIAGVEFGNSASSSFSSTSIIAPGPTFLFGGTGIPGTITTSTMTSMFDVRTRFFDQVNVKYYLSDDWVGYVGHRYLGGKNALALGSEYAFPLASRFKASAFIEARVGEGDFHGVWGGLKFYFSGKDKPLIARHRQDDPNIWGVDSLFSIVNSLTHSGSSSVSQFCNPPATLQNNGSCEALISDTRLKRDIVLLSRLANGVGIYRYRYLWSDTIYVGVMAQEVAAIVPDAVVLGLDGYYRVIYARLGLRMITWDEWTKPVAPMGLALAA
jgi:Chaperone of endosialidase